MTLDGGSNKMECDTSGKSNPLLETSVDINMAGHLVFLN